MEIKGLFNKCFYVRMADVSNSLDLNNAIICGIKAPNAPRQLCSLVGSEVNSKLLRAPFIGGMYLM